MLPEIGLAVVSGMQVVKVPGNYRMNALINQQRGKTVTPLHPVEDELEGIPVLRSLSDLPSPAETSVSIITPSKVREPVIERLLEPTNEMTPQITMSLLQQAKDLGIHAVWIQPGAADPAVIAYIKENGLTDKVVYGGPCVLVEGDDVIRSML
jgi:predicted CoA-binding protein